MCGNASTPPEHESCCEPKASLDENSRRRRWESDPFASYAKLARFRDQAGAPRWAQPAAGQTTEHYLLGETGSVGTVQGRWDAELGAKLDGDA
jgi:hypothetical protein